MASSYDCESKLMNMSSQRKARRTKWWIEQQEKKRRKKENNDKDVISVVKSHPKPKISHAKVSTSRRGFRSHDHTQITSEVTKPNAVREESVMSTTAALLSSDDSSCDEDVEASGYEAEVTQASTNSDVQIQQTQEEKTKMIVGKPKRRYILFLGNLSPTSTCEEILAHFRKRGVPIKDLRLLTHKDTGNPRGCAFAEFESDRVLKNALKFHRSKLNGKAINIEVTCGGGGSGTDRKTKIMKKNRRQRNTRARKSVK